MTKLAWLMRTPFSFLLVQTRAEDRAATYVIREHRRGRCLEDILDDPYLRNRLSVGQIARLLEQPDLVHVLGDDVSRELHALADQFSAEGHFQGSSTRMPGALRTIRTPFPQALGWGRRGLAKDCDL